MNHCSVNLGDPFVGGFECGFLLGIAEPEQGRTLSHVATETYIDLLDASVCFRKNGDRAKKGGDVFGRRVEVKDHRNQSDCKHYTSGNSVSELVPYRVKRNLLTEPLALTITTIKIVRQDCEQGAKQQLKHAYLRCFRGRPFAEPAFSGSVCT